MRLARWTDIARDWHLVWEKEYAHEAQLPSCEGSTMLQFAVQRRAPAELIELMLESRPDIVDNCGVLQYRKGAFTHTPLQLAVCDRGAPVHWKRSVIEVLMSFGADISTTGAQKRENMLHAAARARVPAQIVRVLLFGTTQPERLLSQRNTRGFTPHDVAVQSRCDADVCAVLLVSAPPPAAVAPNHKCSCARTCCCGWCCPLTFAD